MRGCFFLMMKGQEAECLVEEMSVACRALLDSLAPTGGHLSRRKALKSVSIYQDGARMMKRTNQVFPCARVDRHLAADGSIHLREQRGGNLQESDAAQVNGGRVAVNTSAGKNLI